MPKKQTQSAVVQLVGPHVHKQMLKNSRLNEVQSLSFSTPQCQKPKGEVLPSPFDDYAPPK